jgi:tRNA G18 (ribose-2'-O)-methylase SpoU
LGNEISGVSEEALTLVDAVLEIPQFGMKHSLNVSVSAGIVAWQLIQGRLEKISAQSTS